MLWYCVSVLFEGGECRRLVVMLIYVAMHYPTIVFRDCVYCTADTLPGRTYEPM